jgi:hypothetical protein
VSQIGDVGILREDSGCQGITLVEAVAKAMATHESPSKSLSGGLLELVGVITAIDSYLAKTCKLLNKKIRALEQQLGAVPLAAPTLPVLTMLTPIHDDHGVCVTTLGGLLQKNPDLKHDDTLLVERLDRLAADVTAQGGVMLGKHTFTSEAHLLELCMKECPKGDAFATFVNLMVVFVLTYPMCHSLGGRHSPRPWKSLGVIPSLTGRWSHHITPTTLTGFLRGRLQWPGRLYQLLHLRNSGKGWVGWTDDMWRSNFCWTRWPMECK